MNTLEWLKKEGYPEMMPMSIDNLANIIDRFNYSQASDKDKEIERLNKVISKCEFGNLYNEVSKKENNLKP